jgi:secreted trypsin-like serine protease
MKKIFLSLILVGGSLLAQSQDQPEIVGGAPVNNGDYPFMATLLEAGSTDPNDLNDNFFCGGSLITDQWVLSAAHCLIDYNTGNAIAPHEVEIGFNIYALEDPNGNWIHRTVDTVIVHPDFLSGADDNSDVALIKLSQPVNIKPVKLPANSNDTVHEMVGTSLRSIGFGANKDPNVVPVYHQSDTLLFVDLTVITVDSAKSLDASYSTLNEKALPTLAPDPVQDKSPCFGDSGGPLFNESGSDPVQVGVVSWGVYCGDADYAAVFARVSSQVSWIKSHIANLSTLEAQEVELAYVGEQTLYLFQEGLESEITVFDGLGRTVKTIKANTNEVDLSGLTAGYYILSVQKGTNQNKFKYVAH